MASSYRVASDPWKPWKNPEMIDTPGKVPEIPWKLRWSLKKYEKMLAKIGIYSEMIVPVAISSILVPKFSPATGNYHHCILLHSLVFSIFPVCDHPGKQSCSKRFKDTWKIINWHRNCLLSTPELFVTSIGQWICVITEWLSTGNVHIVVSAVNGLQSVVISLLCHPASSAGFDGPS